MYHNSLHPFYLIVPDLIWLERAISNNVSMIQLRAKNLTHKQAKHIVREALDIVKNTPVTLWINDYWKEAIEEGAQYLHLGQEDLRNADIIAIKNARIKLGISTHDKAEHLNALAHNPDYTALGPIHETKLKKMKWYPQGTEKITQWKKKQHPIPLVAIGGLTLERADAAYRAGADSIAVVTDVITAPNWQEKMKKWVTWSHMIHNQKTPPDPPTHQEK